MNKHQKLVQQQFINDEEKVIKRLESVYNKSYQDITGKISELDKSISSLKKIHDSIGDDDLGDLAAAYFSKKPYITAEEAKATLQSQIQSKVYQKKYQTALQNQVDKVLDKMLDQEFKTVADYIEQCYENGFVGTMYDLNGQGIPLCFPMDQEAMVRAVQLDSKISQGLYQKLGEDVSLLKRKIAAQVSRGIASGMSFQQVAQQLAGNTKIGYNNAVRIARTEGHRVQVQSAMDACYKAKDKGANVVKQWDSTLDSRTRESHMWVDGEIRELDEKFSNGLMFPGDPDGGAAEVINCRCALLQRAKWALDEDELQVLKDRAKQFGLDKTDSFEDFKAKYLKAAEQIVPEPPKKKEYLTEKKLKSNIADIEEKQKLLIDGSDEWKQLEDLKADYQEKLNKKLVAKETKKLKKEEILLQEQLDDFEIKTYSNIWKDDVTTADWSKLNIEGKKKYYEGKFITETDPAKMKEFQDLYKQLQELDDEGKKYFEIQNNLNKVKNDLTKLQKNGIILPNNADAFTPDRKNAAHWFTDRNGSVRGADSVLRDKSGEVWRAASNDEKDSIFEYTQSYSKYNEPLRGYEYGTNKFLGVGNVDLNKIGTSYGGYKPGQVKKLIDDMTSIIDKSEYDFDIWLQRGCKRTGMDKFFGVDPRVFDLPEAELSKILVGTTPTEYAFMSTGVAKGKGLNLHSGILMNVYAPKGTKMMYVEPFSAFGNGHQRSWDGISKQMSFGSEAEMILQRGTKFRVTKVEKSGGMIYVDMEVIEQGVF